MYGGRREFEGRITGFTMGTGSDPVAAAAAERHGQLREDRPAAAGPHRADRLRPDKAPLFVGLSVVPYVYYKEPPTGPHAGEVLQPLRCRRPRQRPTRPTSHCAEQRCRDEASAT